MNKKKTFTLISLAAILATTSTFLHAGPIPKETTGGKFHIVYLVSAVDLKPGSPVSVDPIFISDGRKNTGFHVFCLGIHDSLLPPLSAMDRKFMADYCSHKAFTIPATGFHTINNHGQQISLDSIEFGIIGETTVIWEGEDSNEPDLKDSVMMGKAKVASFTPGTINPPKWLRNDGAPEYFFLMSRDKQILEQIVPVSHATPAEVGALTKRAIEFSKIAKWRLAGRLTYLKDVENAKPGLCYGATDPVVFRMENPLIIDLDADGKLDMYVNVYTTVKHKLEKLETQGPDQLINCFSTYRILGNGESVLAGSETALSSGPENVNWYHRYVRNGYPAQTNLMSLRYTEQNRTCIYILGYDAPQYLLHPRGYGLMNMNCSNEEARKPAFTRQVFPMHVHPGIYKH